MSLLPPRTESMLTEALRRYEHAAEPDLIVRHAAWPEMERFQSAAWQLAVAATRFARNKSVEDDDRRWAAARRLLRSSFISPSHPDVGLANRDKWGAVADGELGALQDTVRAAAAELVAGPHRSLDALQAFFSENPKLRWPKRGSVRVLVPRRAAAGTLEALQSLSGTEGISWEVCTLSEAKHLGSCDVTLLAGPPELFEGWRTEEALRPRRVSWLFNAPMSRHIVALTWSGSEPIRSDVFEPYPGAEVLDSRRWVDVDTAPRDNVADRSVAIRPTSRPPEPRVQHAAADDIVEAIDFELPGGTWISFGTETGPLARRIDDDAEFDVEIESVKAVELRPGNTLVIMSSTADRDLRNKLCGEWLDGQPDRPTFERASQTIDAYKSAARRYLAHSESIRELGKLGLAEPYVRSQFHRSHPRSPAMAPQARKNFEIIASAAGWEPPLDAWTHVEALRAGFMHAGREIMKLLAEHVAEDRDWVDLIDQQEIAVMTVRGVGAVTLAPILAISPDRAFRSVSELGEVVQS